MSRFIFAVVALVLLLAAILVVAPGLVPVGAYKGRLEAAASKALGRAVTIGDDLSFKLVPQTAFRVSDLEIANAAGFDAPYLARVKNADIGVKLFPLFSGSVEVDRFVLTEPDINLARAADGRVNWNFAGAGDAAADQEGGAGAELRDVRLGDVRIVGGKAAYADAAAGKAYALSDIDLAARLDSLAEPLEVEGAMTFDGAPSRIDMVLTSLRKILDNEPANLKLNLTLGQSEIGGDLVVATKDALSYSGPVTLNAPNLSEFAALLGAPLTDAPGFDALKVSGNAQGGPDALALSGAKIDFDKIDASGDLALNWGGARPMATGRLAAGVLDLRPYLPPPSESASGFPAWSEDRLDFSSLRNINANIDLTADKIFLNELEFGESRLKLTIVNGLMTADIPELGLYGGGGSGQLKVNARSATPSFDGKFDMGSVDAQPFSLDLLKTDRLLGLGGFKFDFKASGASQAAIMRSMNGSGGFDVADGALKYIDLAKIARSYTEISKGGFNPATLLKVWDIAMSPAETTEFSTFLSNFKIANGIVSTGDISLSGPLVTMTGAGTIDLPQQKLDLHLRPRAVEPGEDGRQSPEVPFVVRGTFSKPDPTFDTSALPDLLRQLSGRNILSDPAKKGGGAGGGEKKPADPAQQIIEGIFGPPPGEESEDKPDDEGSGAAGPGGQAAAKSSAGEAIAKDALNQLFGRTKKQEAEPAEAAESEPH